jgi:WD40 repeat protein
MDAVVTLEGVGASASRVAGGSTAMHGGVAAVAAWRHVLLLAPRDNAVLATLAGHGDRVNGVAWLAAPLADDDAGAVPPPLLQLVSCSVDGTVRVWSAGPALRGDDGLPYGWRCDAVLTGHRGPVSGVAALALPGGAAVVASVGTDSTLRAWVRLPESAAPHQHGTWTPAGTVTLRPASTMETVALTTLPGYARAAGVAPADAGVLLAAGGVDGRVHLYTLARNSSSSGDEHHSVTAAVAAPGSSSTRLVELLSLSGHLDWVRCLAFSHHTEIGCASAGGDAARHVMLASGSTDGKVRLWRVALTATLQQGGAAEGGERAPAVNNDGSDGDDDDEEEEDGAPPPAGDGGAADAPAREKGSLLQAASFLQHQAALVTGAVASLQRPRVFAVGAGSTTTRQYEVTFDAMLSGHSGWVSSVQWRAPVRLSSPHAPSSKFTWWQPPTVISSSTDKTVVIWQPSGAASASSQRAADGGGDDDACDETALWSGVWEPCRRIGGAGEVGGMLGLLSGRLTDDGGVILAHSLNGALHAWHCKGDGGGAAGGRTRHASFATRAQCVGATYKQQWQQAPAPTGHFGGVSDLCWGTDGAYLVSTGADATTRVWAPLAVAGTDASSISTSPSWTRQWCEVGRPQIHGYEMTSATVPPVAGLPHRMFSSGDEKVVRVFDAPLQFTAALAAVSGGVLSAEGRLPRGAADAPTAAAADSLAATRAAFAYIPELALTNKGVAADAVAAPIADRLQIDGSDAVVPEHVASAAANRDAMRAAVLAGDGGGAAGTRSSGAPHDADDGEAVELTALRPATLAAASAPAAAPVASAGGVALPPVSTADRATAPYVVDPAAATAAAGAGAAPSSTAPPCCPPPLEDDLVTHTRWPETDKLFAHPHEVVAVAAAPGGSVVASSCKARSAGDAAVHLWDGVTARHLQALPAHKLTPIALAFSHPNGCGVVPAAGPAGTAGRWYVAPHLGAAAAGGAAATAGVDRESDFLATVGKDRQVALYARAVDAARSAPPPPAYRLLATFTAHKRIIWGVTWAPLPVATSLLSERAPWSSGSGNSAQVEDTQVALFATGARDQSGGGCRRHGDGRSSGRRSSHRRRGQPPSWRRRRRRRGRQWRRRQRDGPRTGRCRPGGAGWRRRRRPCGCVYSDIVVAGSGADAAAVRSGGHSGGVCPRLTRSACRRRAR